MRLHRKYLDNPWVVQAPWPKQALFFLHDAWFEGLYGGAAGGAKSSALLMAAAADVDVPGYSALLLRRTFRDLNQPDALIPRSKEWWSGKAHWDGSACRWTFPSGATITFGYLERDDSVYQYQGAAFQMIGVDELTQHTEMRYTYLASRLRRPTSGPLSEVPLRLRGATNPGGLGHDWVKQRFLDPAFLRSKEQSRFDRPWFNHGRFFVPSKLKDNPALDAAAYERDSLSQLLPVVREQLKEGDWNAHAGGHFQQEWLQPFVEQEDAYWMPTLGEVAKKWECAIVVAVDPAGGVSEDADYTAIVVCALTPAGTLLVLEVVRERLGVEGVVPRLADVCMRRRPMWVVIESAFAQSAYLREARRTSGIPTVHPIDPGGQSKLVRATPMILRGKQRRICLPRDQAAHSWVEPFVSELCAFTGDDRLDAYDDQVDALAYLVLAIDRFGLGSDDDGPAIHRRHRG